MGVSNYKKFLLNTELIILQKAFGILKYIWYILRAQPYGKTINTYKVALMTFLYFLS